MRQSKTFLVIVAIALVSACGDDGGSKPDSAVSPDQGQTDTNTPTPDSGPGSEQGTPTPDQGTPTPDQGTPTPDGGGGTPKILTNSHTGWQKKDCSTCHTLPVQGHTTSNVWECAQCHGGNGACNPNGANSPKKNHTSSLSCPSCHGTKHGQFNSANQCVSCHFASSGTIDCP
jgi:hypothetical protein